MVCWTMAENGLGSGAELCMPRRYLQPCRELDLPEAVKD